MRWTYFQVSFEIALLLINANINICARRTVLTVWMTNDKTE